jgi:hypothetical protein
MAWMVKQEKPASLVCFFIRTDLLSAIVNRAGKGKRTVQVDFPGCRYGSFTGIMDAIYTCTYISSTRYCSRFSRPGSLEHFEAKLEL